MKTRNIQEFFASSEEKKNIQVLAHDGVYYPIT